MNHTQLTFDLINANEPNLEELAANENQHIIEFLSMPQKWPENKVFIYGTEYSGYKFICENISKKENIETFEISNNIILNEAELFEIIIKAESQKIFLIIYSNILPNELKINSADLKSRLDGIMCLKCKDANSELLIKIFENWAKNYSIIIKRNDIKLLLNSLKIDFVINYKLIKYIKENYTIGSKLSKLEVKKIINNFEASI